MTNPWDIRRQQHRIGKQGRHSEVRVAGLLDGKLRPASGAVPGAKGDIDLPGFLLEAKSTTNDSMSIKLDWLAKIGVEARTRGRKPGVVISFVDQQGVARRDGDYVMIPMHVFKELVDKPDGD